MAEIKPTASLSGLLLARKGAARPAMRRPAAFERHGNTAVAMDDLGWNDMGYDVDPDHDAPMDHVHNNRYNPLAGAVPEVTPELREQQEKIAAQLEEQAKAGFDAIPEMVANAGATVTSINSVHSLHRDDADVETDLDMGAQVGTDESEEENAPLLVERKKRIVPASRPAGREIAAVRRRAAPGSKGKAAFTLRLDSDRHLKLRLACTLSNQSAQMLVTEALDQLLDSMPEVTGLMEQFPKRKNATH